LISLIELQANTHALQTSGMPIVQEEKLRVNWVDTDASGRIHYTAALRYFEIAEHALMRRLLAGQEFKPGSSGFSMPRVHVEADFKLGLRYGDEFTCSARVEKVGESSVTYAFEIRDLAGQLAIQGRIVGVFTDLAGRKTPLPDALRPAFERAL
jgi:YbgC/YbaW family acyl-CoA thioester hydrolase